MNKEKCLVQDYKGRRSIGCCTWSRGRLYDIQKERLRLKSFKLQHEQLGAIIDGGCVYSGEKARSGRNEAVNRLVNAGQEKITGKYNLEYYRVCLSLSSGFKKWSTLKKYFDLALIFISEEDERLEQLKINKVKLKKLKVEYLKSDAELSKDLLDLQERVESLKVRGSPGGEYVVSAVRLIKRMKINKDKPCTMLDNH